MQVSIKLLDLKIDSEELELKKRYFIQFDMPTSSNTEQFVGLLQSRGVEVIDFSEAVHLTEPSYKWDSLTRYIIGSIAESVGIFN